MIALYSSARLYYVHWWVNYFMWPRPNRPSNNNISNPSIFFVWCIISKRPRSRVVVLAQSPTVIPNYNRTFCFVRVSRSHMISIQSNSVTGVSCHERLSEKPIRNSPVACPSFDSADVRWSVKLCTGASLCDSSLWSLPLVAVDEGTWDLWVKFDAARYSISIKEIGQAGQQARTNTRKQWIGLNVRKLSRALVRHCKISNGLVFGIWTPGELSITRNNDKLHPWCSRPLFSVIFNSLYVTLALLKKRCLLIYDHTCRFVRIIGRVEISLAFSAVLAIPVWRITSKDKNSGM